MMKTFSAQKSRNESHSVVVWPAMPLPSSCGQPGISAVKNVCIASPPIQVWMPNQPQATSARSSAGTFAPIVPNARAAEDRERDAVLRARRER